MKPLRILVTGSAGFIGSSLSRQLLKKHTVIGVDNYYPNYPIRFKKTVIKELKKNPNFYFFEEDIQNYQNLSKLISKHKIEIIFHLAALTGVRASLDNPKLYQEVNTLATKNIYQVALNTGVKKFIFTSSSSVYGNSKQIPFIETQKLMPQSPYAVSKRDAEELLLKMPASKKLSTTIFRLFSVYGPQGRPDMAPYLFTQAALTKKPITLFGDGSQARDFTYIDDVIDAFTNALSLTSPREIINIGNTTTITVSKLINTIEQITGEKIQVRKAPTNSAESYKTQSNIEKAKKVLRWNPKIPFSTGIRNFIDWYKTNRLS